MITTDGNKKKPLMERGFFCSFTSADGCCGLTSGAGGKKKAPLSRGLEKDQIFLE